MFTTILRSAGPARQSLSAAPALCRAASCGRPGRHVRSDGISPQPQLPRDDIPGDVRYRPLGTESERPQSDERLADADVLLN
jgi:hypothetical protein